MKFKENKIKLGQRILIDRKVHTNLRSLNIHDDIDIDMFCIIRDRLEPNVDLSKVFRWDLNSHYE